MVTEERRLQNLAKVAAYRKKYPERVKAVDIKQGIRKSELKAGALPGSFNALNYAQGARCAICMRTALEVGTAKPRLAFDHNDKTKTPRALLCGPCNNGIGLYQEDIQRIKDVIKYLSFFNKDNI